MNTSAYQPNIESVERAGVHPDPLLPAFPVLHDHLRHFMDAFGSVVFIMCLLSHILQVLHVCTHQHAPQQQEVRVNRILHWHVQRQHACMNSWTGCKNTPRKMSSEYLLLYPRDKSDLWPFVLCSPPERYSQWLQTGFCPAKREAAI